MRLLIQRVACAKVTVEENIVGEIGKGLLVLLGIHTQDKEDKISSMVEKLLTLRIFADEEGKMNRSLIDIKGDLLIVSQFTLYGDCSAGRRPSFIQSAPGQMALPFYEAFISRAKVRGKELGIRVEEGVFGAYMQVSLQNDGPVTLIMESDLENPGLS